MSQSQLTTAHFKAATWSGGQPGVGTYDPGDLTPEGIMLDLAATRLLNDSVIQSLVTPQGIEEMDIRNPFDLDALPKIQCYLGSLREDRIATQLDDTEVITFFGYKLPGMEAFSRMEFGEVGWSRVLWEIKRVLKEYKSAQVELTAKPGKETALARNSNQEGSIDFIPDLDDTGAVLSVTFEVGWRWRLSVDARTGNLYNQD